MKNRICPIAACLAALLLSACCLFDPIYYKTMETFGLQKRDLLASKVEKARNAQKETCESFQSALERFSDVVAFNGGDLQKTYDRLSAELRRCETRAAELDTRIDSVQDVAEALFKEWKSELSQYTNKDYRRDSEQKLRLTRERYDRMIDSMLAARKRVDPVLTVFRDQVLYLKHNLNASALSAIRGESDALTADVQALLDDLAAATAEADRFIASLSD